MAIQLRRGAETDYDASRMLPGEAAVFLDTEQMVFKGNTNSVRLLGNNAQSFDTSEQAQIRANISAVSASDIGFTDIVKVVTPTFSSLPQTFTATGLTASHELIQQGHAWVCNANQTASLDSAMGSDWTISTAANSITISGTFSGSTAARIVATMGVPKAITAS